jgi:predicted outer membrane protein
MRVTFGFVVAGSRAASAAEMPLLFAALALAALGSFAAHESLAAPSQESFAFASEAASSGAHILQSSKIAQRTSRDERVRAFATQLSRDYTQASETLLRICRRKEITLPTQSPDATSMPDEAGSTFDRVYSLEMSQHLAKLQALYARALEAAKLDPELETFARDQLSIVRKQATQADALARQQAGTN